MINNSVLKLFTDYIRSEIMGGEPTGTVNKDVLESIYAKCRKAEQMNTPTTSRPWVKQRKASHASRSHDPYYQTKEWKQRRKAQLDAEPLCAGPDSYCAGMGRVTPATVADHIIPREQGGSDEPHNLQSLCGSCHNKKSGRERR